MVNKIKTNVGITKNSPILAKFIRKFVSSQKPKVVYPPPFLSSLPFPKFKKNSMYFGRKHVT